MIQKKTSENEKLQKNSQQYFNLIKTKFQTSKPLKNLTCIYVHNDTLYLGTRQSKLFIFEIVGHNLVDGKIIIPHCQIVSSISANQKYFVTVAQSDGQMPITIWDVKNKMFITALKSHQSQVSKVIFLSQPGWLASSSWDCTVKIWDMRNILEWQQNIRTIKSEYPVLTVAQVTEDIIAFGGDDCYINVWNWRTMESLGKYFGHAGSVTLIYAEGSYLFSAGGDHKLKQWYFKPLGSSVLRLQSLDSRKSMSLFQQQKAIIRVSRQIKKTYDSSIFVVKINLKDRFLLDRHGVRFLHRFGYDLISSTNNFKYNENITGMVHHKDKIYVTTTKGQLQCFSIQILKNPFQEI